MKMIYNNSINPIQEHLVEQETLRRHCNLIGYFLSFCLGIFVWYLVTKIQAAHRIKEAEK
jgi:hypothetical protein